MLDERPTACEALTAALSLATIRSCARVSPPVACECGGVAERGAAIGVLALVRFLPGMCPQMDIQLKVLRDDGSHKLGHRRKAFLVDKGAHTAVNDLPQPG
jgi:hypothetical protein